jgi:hypothetical protein
MSDLLKAVLLEMHGRSTRDVTPEAEWAPLPPGGLPSPLPSPPPRRRDATLLHLHPCVRRREAAPEVWQALSGGGRMGCARCPNLAGTDGVCGCEQPQKASRERARRTRAVFARAEAC